MGRDLYNASGCLDPTAYRAMKNIQDADRVKARKLIKELNAAIDASGFVLLNRIKIKDKKSGTIFK